MNIEQLREAIEYSQQKQADYAGQKMRFPAYEAALLEAAATLLRVVEGFPEHERPPIQKRAPFRSGFVIGFNKCRTEIINLIGVEI